MKVGKAIAPPDFSVICSEIDVWLEYHVVWDSGDTVWNCGTNLKALNKDSNRFGGIVTTLRGVRLRLEFLC